MARVIYWGVVAAIATRAPASSEVEEVMRARQLLVEAEAHWNEDNFEPAIATYETALALVNCSSDVCVSLEEHEHLQAHANLGSAHMSRAHAGAQPEALGTELEEMIASERHWVIPHAARPSATSAFFLKLLRADIQMAHAALRHDAGGKASSATLAAPPALRVEPVQRRAAANISVAEFLAEYELRAELWDLDDESLDALIARLRQQ